MKAENIKVKVDVTKIDSVVEALEKANDLQQRIDKAIEYILRHYYTDNLGSLVDGYLDVYEANKLLEILKGDSNE